MADETSANGYLPLFSNPLSSFEVGAITDLRFRLGCELLKSEHFLGKLGHQDTVEIAHGALDLANEVINQAIARGWVKEIDATEVISSRVNQHLKRTATAQVLAQRYAQEAAQDMDPGLARVQRILPNQ